MTTDTKKSYPFAFWAITFMFILEYTRPMDIFKPLSYLFLTKLLALFLLFHWYQNSDKSEFKEKVIVYYMAFFLLICVSMFWVVNHGATKNVIIGFLIGMVAFVLPFIQIINTRERMMDFFYYYMIANGILSIYAITHKGVGPGAFVYDENDTALALNMAIPFAFLLARSTHYTAGQKKILLMIGGILCLGVIATFSRGGLLGMIAVMGVFWWWSKSKFKSLIIMSVLLTVSFFAAYNLGFISEEWIKDMQSIQDTEDDTRNERFLSWELGWEMFKANPFIGVGADNYAWNVGMYEQALKENNPYYKSLGGRQSHSVYFTLIPELGLIGIYIYFSLLYYMNKSCKTVLNLKKSHPDNTDLDDYALIALAIRMSIVAFLITGVFISVLYYPNLWYLIGFLVATERLATAAAQVNNPAEEPVIEAESEHRAESESISEPEPQTARKPHRENNRISYKL